MGKITSLKDLIILLLYAKGRKGTECEPIIGRTRMVKMVFLFDKEIRNKFNKVHSGSKIDNSVLPDFSAYDYGPFSAKIYSDLEFLVDAGFVNSSILANQELLPEESLEYTYWQAGGEIRNEQGVPKNPESFMLTTLGIDFVKSNKIGPLVKEQWKLLEEFKARCTGVELRALLRYVYEKYPDMSTHSKIREEILSEYRF